MALVFERVLTEGLGDLSYLIGDDEAGIAAVIDPRADVEVYLRLAHEHKVAITHILQTHIHEDFLCGAVALAKRVGGAVLPMRHAGGARYGYEHRELHDGERITLGSVLLTARATPGHTPEHTAFLIAEKEHLHDPYAVFSGGSLLVNAAGRCDLLGLEEAQRLVVAQYETLYKFFLGLPEHVIVHPTHAHGSPCGASIGDRLSSTIGYERKFNPFLQHSDFDSFKAFALGNLPAKPTYYSRLKEANTAGNGMTHPPAVAALPARTFQSAFQSAPDPVIVDTRDMHAFAGGHIPGSINIGSLPELSIWAGWMLDPQESIFLVMERDADLDRIVSLFQRTGFTALAGYLVGGMKAWCTAGLPLATLAPMPVHALEPQLRDRCVLDVRADEEWAEGRIPGAKHIFLPELPRRLQELDPAKPISVYCATGYRASIASSLLKREGFQLAETIPGSWQAWCNAKLPKEA